MPADLAEAGRPVPVTLKGLNPGLMPGTGLARGNGAIVDFVWGRVLPLLRAIAPGVNSVEESGSALARLVADPALAGVTGRYYEGREAVESSPESHDRQRARELWEASAAMARLSPEESHASRLPTAGASSTAAAAAAPRG